MKEQKVIFVQEDNLNEINMKLRNGYHIVSITPIVNPEFISHIGSAFRGRFGAYVVIESNS